MELGLVLTLCGLGGTFWLVALVLGMITINRKKKCTACTSAEVVAVTARSSGDGMSFHPVYEYYVDGVRYRRTGSYISNQVPGEGTIVEIMYNPARPEKSYILDYDDKVYRILSVVFAVIGCIPVLICICIAFS